MINVRKWTLGRAGAVLAALTTVVAVSVSGATPASAAPDTTCTNLRFHGVNWGGTYFCNYGAEAAIVSNGNLQVFVVAGAHNVFTRWQRADFSLSSWVNLGGTVKSNGDGGYLAAAEYYTSNGNYTMVKVIGTDGRKYCNIRSPHTSNWNGWTRGHCDDL
jgi:hypothetical protein